MPEHPQRQYKFFVLFFLYVAPFVPLMFFPIVFPVMLRQSGAPLERIGLFGIFAIPVVLKFLWAPYVDKYGSNRFGHYKIWLVATQLICAVLGCIIAFLSFTEQFWWIMGLGLLFVTSVSTQWIAVNGLAIQCLTEKERPRGNSLATMGMAIGTITGGSMLILVSRIGYVSTMILTYIPLIVASVILLFFKEPHHPEVRANVNILSSFGPLKSASMRRWLLLINLFIIGDAMIIAMVRPMLVDKGLSLDTIGVMLGTIRPVFATIGAALCSPIIKRFSRRTNLISFGIGNALVLALFILPAMNITGNNFLYVIFALGGLANSFKWTLIYSIFMDHSRKALAATDFAIQVSVLTMGSSLYEMASGVIAASIGYASLFSVSVVLDLVGILLIGLYYQDAQTVKTPEPWNDGAVEAEAVG
ncbi:MAG TPA: MFS transporter [Bacteroidota bacterium]|nr:MFS transporter [Bacteroidota bacterium]